MSELCPICAVPLDRSPLPIEPGPYSWVRMNCAVGRVGDSYVVHGECLGPMNYFRWSRIRSYQKWRSERSQSEVSET